MDRVTVVAELGGTHCGDPSMALQLVDMAADSGADAVKFQRRNMDRLYTRAFLDSPYVGPVSHGSTYGEHRRALELSLDELAMLRDRARERGILFGCTAFEEDSLSDLALMGVDFIKLASGSLSDWPLIEAARETGLPVVASTGGGMWADVDGLYGMFTGYRDRLTILHCTAAYPVRDWSELNLSCIPEMVQRYPDVRIGASLHDNGIAMAVAAVALGARMIERHVTMDRSLPGTDHSFSLEPQGLEKMVRDIRRLEQALGDGIKQPYKSEQAPLSKMTRSVRAARDLPRGHVLRAGDLVLRSPGDGLPAHMLPDLFGRTLDRSLSTDDLLSFGDVS